MKNKGKVPSISYSTKEGDELVDKIIADMGDLVDDEKIVYPTLLTKSRRGLQYIILYEEPIKKTDSEAMFKHRKLYSTITTYLQGLYDRNVVEVNTAVTDAPRICRLPGTKHLKNDRYAELQEYNATCYYDLDELCELFEVDLTPEEKKKAGRPKKNATEKKNTSSSSNEGVKYRPIGPKELPKPSAILRVVSKLHLLQQLKCKTRV